MRYRHANVRVPCLMLCWVKRQGPFLLAKRRNELGMAIVSKYFPQLNRLAPLVECLSPWGKPEHCRAHQHIAKRKRKAVQNNSWTIRIQTSIALFYGVCVLCTPPSSRTPSQWRRKDGEGKPVFRPGCISIEKFSIRNWNNERKEKKRTLDEQTLLRISGLLSF